MERSFSSLAVCYAFLASLAAMLLIYARIELQANPPDWSNLVGSLSHESGWSHALNGAQLAAAARSALFTLRDRMHTSWLFFAVFGAVWLGCLLWMEMERRRRRIDFSRREAWWIVGYTLLVFAMAVLYGLGTNGILARRLPNIVPVADFVAVAFVLTLPLAAWSWLGVLEEEQEEEEHADYRKYLRDSPEPGRRGFLGLDDDATNARLMESLSRIEVKPVELSPAMQAFHPETPSEQSRPGAIRVMETTEAPPPPSPAPEIAPPVASAAVEAAAPSVPNTSVPGGTGIEAFRHQLAAMNGSWQRIEAIRNEIDKWFEVRRSQATAHFDSHPGMRAPAIEKTLFDNFPNDKLAAIDAEWAAIHNAVIEISRWFGDVPPLDQSKSK